MVENECKPEDDESLLSLIDEVSTDDESDEGSIRMNNLEEICYESQIYPEINARDARLKIRDHTKQTQNELKGAKLSAKSMGKGLKKYLMLF